MVSWWQSLSTGHKLMQNLGSLYSHQHAHRRHKEMSAILAPKVCHSVSDSYAWKHALRLRANHEILQTWAKSGPRGCCGWYPLPQILAHSFSENHLWWFESYLTNHSKTSLPQEIGVIFSLAVQALFKEIILSEKERSGHPEVTDLGSVSPWYRSVGFLPASQGTDEVK